MAEGLHPRSELCPTIVTIQLSKICLSFRLAFNGVNLFPMRASPILSATFAHVMIVLYFLFSEQCQTHEAARITNHDLRFHYLVLSSYRPPTFGEGASLSLICKILPPQHPSSDLIPRYPLL